jgi:branched-chain amino acid transport system ATP-binding protein
MNTAKTTATHDAPSATATHVLECKNLCLGYSGVPVVRDLTMHVDEGEVVALLGPNGAGKSTILSALAGLLPIISGTASYLGESIARPPHVLASHGLILVPDDRGLFPDLTTRENLSLALRRGSMSMDEVVDAFPALKPRLKTKAGALSGGEQQMLAVGRALGRRPKLLMVDEMSMGLAPIIVEQLLPRVRALAERSRTAVILVEQHVEMVLDQSDRGYVLMHGEIRMEGPAKDLLANRDVMAAVYLGEGAHVA